MAYVFIPFLILLLAICSFPFSQQLPEIYQLLIKLVAYAILELGVVLAWRYNRSRIFFLLLILIFLFVILTTRTELTEVSFLNLLFCLSVLLPLNTLIISLFKIVAGHIGEVTGGGRPARYGGEEFSVIFPGKSVTDVFAHLEVVRQKIEETPFSIRGKDRPKKAPEKGSGRRRTKTKTKHVKVTVSIGVAELSEKNSTPDEVMKAADKALYRAKEKGRNQVCK